MRDINKKKTYQLTTISLFTTIQLLTVDRVFNLPFRFLKLPLVIFNQIQRKYFALSRDEPGS